MVTALICSHNTFALLNLAVTWGKEGRLAAEIFAVTRYLFYKRLRVWRLEFCLGMWVTGDSKMYKLR